MDPAKSPISPRLKQVGEEVDVDEVREARQPCQNLPDTTPRAL